MSRSIQQATCVPNLKNLSWFMRPWLQKMGLTYFWLWTRSKWPNCDATQTRHVVPPTECIYQVSNWYLKACWRKVRKMRTDGRTDGRTLPRHNTSRFSNGRIKTGKVRITGIYKCHIWFTIGSIGLELASDIPLSEAMPAWLLAQITLWWLQKHVL